jgi:hypothetical protein
MSENQGENYIPQHKGIYKHQGVDQNLIQNQNQNPI